MRLSNATYPAMLRQIAGERNCAQARVAELERLLRWIGDEAALYSEDGRAETMRRIRAALADPGAGEETGHE